MTINPYPSDPDWPTTFNGCRITGRFVTILGVPVTGTISFKPVPDALINFPDDTIITSKSIDVALVNGEFDVVLPATDDPDVSPVGWTYLVTEGWSGGRKYNISAPQNTVVDLTDLAPVASSGGVAITKGETGATGATGPTGPQGPKGDGIDSSGNLTTTGSLTAKAATLQGTVRALFAKTTSTTEHAATIYQAATTGTGVAANLVSDNVDDSTIYVTGVQDDRGVVKVAHIKPTVDDSAASGISIDLQGTGTAAQGIFITSTTGGTTGNLITLRNNAREDLVIKSTGRMGLGLTIGSTPAGMVDIKPYDTTTPGLVVNAVTSGTANLAEFKRASDGAVRTRISSTAQLVTQEIAFFTGAALQVASSSTTVGGGSGGIGLANVGTAPTSNPTGGLFIYSEGEVLKYRGSEGIQTLRTVPAFADNMADLRVKPFSYTDCLGTAATATAPFTTGAVSAGTISGVSAETDHDGIIRFTSSTSTNSGYWMNPATGALLLAAGHHYETVFRVPVSDANTLIRLGFLDTQNNTDATDGAYLEIANLTASAKTASNSTRTTNATTATLTVNTWYRLEIDVDSAASSVTFSVKTMGGSSVLNVTNSTNLPTGTGRVTGVGATATNAGTTAVALLDLDWVAYGKAVALTR